MMTNASTDGLFATAARCLREPDLARKIALTRQTAAAWEGGDLDIETTGAPDIVDTPGRPKRLELVPPRQLAARKLTSREGRAAMIHAVAHIEFNAINLAWDAVQRFREMPVEFQTDWIRIAAEEAEHFAAIYERLLDLGYDYGDFPAHDGLWEMARRTAHDPLARMAMVPRVLEARGLDVTPGMIERFTASNDTETASRLSLILREEVGHVAAGSRWFRSLCQERGLEPRQRYFALIEEYMTGEIRGPLNLSDRRRAGFDPEELAQLEAMAQR